MENLVEDNLIVKDNEKNDETNMDNETLKEFEKIKSRYSDVWVKSISEEENEELTEKEFKEINDFLQNNFVKLIDKINNLKNKLKSNRMKMNQISEINDDYRKVKNNLTESNKTLDNFIKGNSIKLGLIKNLKIDLMENLDNNEDFKILSEAIKDNLNKKRDLIIENENIQNMINRIDKQFIKIFGDNDDIMKKYLNNSSLNISSCKICYTNKVNFCLNPCGHLFCNECLDLLPNNECPTCRKNIISKIKIYSLEEEINKNETSGSVNPFNSLQENYALFNNITQGVYY